MIWSEFAEAAPELARLGEERFDRAGVVLVGTIRKDGSPRISPVEPLIGQGRLLLGMMPRSKKALDLLRDPRCLVHSAIANRHGTEGEFRGARHRGPRHPQALQRSALQENRRSAGGAVPPLLDRHRECGIHHLRERQAVCEDVAVAPPRRAATR